MIEFDDTSNHAVVPLRAQSARFPTRVKGCKVLPLLGSSLPCIRPFSAACVWLKLQGLESCLKARGS